MKKYKVEFKIDTIVEAENKREALERAVKDITYYLYLENIPIDEIIDKISIKEIKKVENKKEIIQ